MNVVVRNIDRPHAEVVAVLGVAGVATVHEAAGQIGLLPPVVRPIQAGARIAGPAVTVLCPPGDNMMVHAAVGVLQPGDVLVIATIGPSTDGVVGELLATQLLVRGCRGAVIGAGVRDVAELREMGFPVWSSAIHAQGTAKESPGSVNVPVEIGTTLINPGDVVIADDDGVAVIPRAMAEEVARGSQERLAKEEAKRARLAAGEMSLDIDGIRTKLDSLGVEWVD